MHTLQRRADTDAGRLHTEHSSTVRSPPLPFILRHLLPATAASSSGPRSSDKLVDPPIPPPFYMSLREVPQLLRRASRIGAAGGRAKRVGHRRACTLLGWAQQWCTASDVGGELLLGEDTKGSLGVWLIIGAPQIYVIFNDLGD